MRGWSDSEIRFYLGILSEAEIFSRDLKGVQVRYCPEEESGGCWGKRSFCVKNFPPDSNPFDTSSSGLMYLRLLLGAVIP